MGVTLLRNRNARLGRASHLSCTSQVKLKYIPSYRTQETFHSLTGTSQKAQIMPTCTHKGCGKTFSHDQNGPESCMYHSGSPVFHEGLKSWSCCSDVSKPVLDFDEFMAIPGCTVGSHTDKVIVSTVTPRPSANSSDAGSLKMTSTSSDGKESYSISTLPNTTPLAPTVTPSTATPSPIIEEEDDVSVSVAPGTMCRRKGCGASFVSDEVNRIGDGEGTKCTYHPSPPIFREGSKGYLCCKRRVLEFDEFLKITGCKTGRHVFAPKSSQSTTEEFTTCRIDHYQTPSEVYVSIFAKQIDKEKSIIKIEQTQLHVDLYLPGNKRFRRTIELFGPVDETESSYKYYGTKVELLLKKLDRRSWTLLEKTNQDLAGISLTFGVGGRTGTVGGKEIVLDEFNKAK